MTTASLSRDADAPLYRQLTRWLEAEMAAGRLGPGERLPSEHTLVRRFGVSRSVVRVALAELGKAGLIFSRHGAGSFVSPGKIDKPIATLTSWRSSIRGAGGEPQARMIASEVVAASTVVAEKLGLPAGAKVLRIERVGQLEDEPAILMQTFLPYARFRRLAGADFSDGSLYEALERLCGVRMTRSESFIEAATASEAEARLLAVKPGALLLIIEGVVFDAEDRPVEYARILHRNDRFRFFLESRREAGPDHPPNETETPGNA
jgi:GntR family transcriptional regulator